ncbi:hypothetical protein [Nocardioides ultimimeridianus]
MNEDIPEPTTGAPEAPETPETYGTVTYEPATPAETPWHPVHIPHLVMGLAFLGLVAVWAIVVPLNAVELPHARWLLPLPWLVAGAAGLVATVLSGRRRRP